MASTRDSCIADRSIICKFYFLSPKIPITDIFSCVACIIQIISTKLYPQALEVLNVF